MGLYLFPDENQVPQVSFICKDPLMKGDGVKTLLLSPECLLCFLHEAGGSAARMGLKCSRGSAARMGLKCSRGSAARMGLKCSRGGQDTLIRRAGCVIRAGDPGSVSCLVGELHDRKEEIAEQTKGLVNPVHEQDFLLGVIPEIPDCPADDAPVLLLHEAVVVLPVRAGPCQGDVLLMAVTDQMVVHELASVIRMDAQKGEREITAYAPQCSEDLFLALVPHCPGLRPPRDNISDIQSAGILPSGSTAFIGHQVHGQDPGRVRSRSAAV